MKHVRRFILIVSVLAFGAGIGWLFEHNDRGTSLAERRKDSYLRINRAVGKSVLQVCTRRGFKPRWFEVQEEKEKSLNRELPKRVWRIRIPIEDSLAGVFREFIRAAEDSGGEVLFGREYPSRCQAIIALGVGSSICDSLIITQDIRRFGSKGKIALIIDDFGYDRTETVNGFLAFPTKIACSIIPGHPYSREIALEAHNHAFEVLIHLPVEPKGPVPRQEYVILKCGMTGKEVKEIMNRAEDTIPWSVGLNNHTGSKGTEDKRLMLHLARELRNRRLFFIDSYTTVKSQALAAMKEIKVSCLKRDVFLDHEETEIFINKQLVKLVEIADRKGWAVGIAHATKPMSLQVLQEEVPKLAAQGYQFIFPSELISQ